MDLRELITAIILGLVEGMTEFVPISSTRHMIIVDDLLLQSNQVLRSQELTNTFKVVIQFGSILAVVIIFGEKLISLMKNPLLLTKMIIKIHDSRYRISCLVLYKR